MLSTLLISIVATLATPAQASDETARRPEAGGVLLSRGLGGSPSRMRSATRLKLESGQGRVGQWRDPRFEGGGAIGLKAGDVIPGRRRCEGRRGRAGVVRAKSAPESSQSATVEYRPATEAFKQEVTLKGRPLEPSDAFEVEYGSVGREERPVGSGRSSLRPKGTGKHPALMLIQGIGNVLVATGSTKPSGWAWGPQTRRSIDDFHATGGS